MAWISFAIVLVALATYAVVRLFMGKPRGREDLAQQAKRRADDVRNAAEASMAAELAVIRDARVELEAIRSIDNDAERLQALADYANRRRVK